MSFVTHMGVIHYCPRTLPIDLWLFDLESSVRVTCDLGYLYANFSLNMSLCSWL